MEKFVEPYKIKKIISENVVELELLAPMKIHLVVNMSRIALYQEQIEGQKKISLSLIEINKEKKYEVEKILNGRYIRGKPKYLVRQKDYIAEKDTWEGLKKLGNIMDLVEEFEKEIREEKIKRVQIRKKEGEGNDIESESRDV